jgi:myo-inositol-1-phosphate synthase
MKDLVPLPSIYYSDFIAQNQCDRADNIIPGSNKLEHLNVIRSHIREFKAKHSLDKVIILWTANTERFCVEQECVHGSIDALLKSIEESHPEISPSTVFAVASVLEGCSYINGSPQNTLVKGLL